LPEPTLVKRRGQCFRFITSEFESSHGLEPLRASEFLGIGIKRTFKVRVCVKVVGKMRQGAACFANSK
jgi:hypothetical protein